MSISPNKKLTNRMGMYVYFRLSKMSKSESLCKVFVYGTLKRGNNLNMKVSLNEFYFAI